MNDDNNKFDLRINKLRKVSAIIGVVGLLLLLSIFIFDLSYPNILFSIAGTLSLALVFISAGIYIATWVMDIHLAYKRKQYILLLLLILAGIIFVFWQIYWNR